MSLAIDPNQENPYKAYCRSSSTSKCELESQFKNLYGFAPDDQNIRCIVTPSGMSAINSVMYGLALKYPNGVFVLANELYCDVPRSGKYIQRTFPNLTIEYVDVRNQDQLLQLFDKYQVTMFHLETCSNPSGQMISWPILKQLKKKSPKCVIVADNTWLTSTIFNPFKINEVDLVIESLSKYNSNGKCIGGMIIGRRKLLNPIKEWIIVNGLFVGGDHCLLFSKAIHSLSKRVHSATGIANVVANSLDQDKTITVMYPMLKTHPTFEIYQTYCQCGPAVMWIHIQTDCSLNDLKLILEQSDLKLETSFGAPHSKIDPWPRLGGSFDYHPSDSEYGQQGCWIRLAIGHQDHPKQIIESMKKIISQLQTITDDIKDI